MEQERGGKERGFVGENTSSLVGKSEVEIQKPAIKMSQQAFNEVRTSLSNSSSRDFLGCITALCSTYEEALKPVIDAEEAPSADYELNLSVKSLKESLQRGPVNLRKVYSRGSQMFGDTFGEGDQAVLDDLTEISIRVRTEINKKLNSSSIWDLKCSLADLTKFSEKSQCEALDVLLRLFGGQEHTSFGFISKSAPYSHSTSDPTAAQAHLRVMGEDVVPRKGPRYIYEDDSHVKKTIDGEVVNAQWGVTKAGKARKRLAIACITCREKKIRCEPGDVKCVQCDKSGRDCRFQMAPRSQDVSSNPVSYKPQAPILFPRSGVGSWSQHTYGAMPNISTITQNWENSEPSIPQSLNTPTEAYTDTRGSLHSAHEAGIEYPEDSGLLRLHPSYYQAPYNSPVGRFPSPYNSKRNKGVTRTPKPIPCTNCRRGELRCRPALDNSQNRCLNCIRLKKECLYNSIERIPQDAIDSFQGSNTSIGVGSSEAENLYSGSVATVQRELISKGSSHVASTPAEETTRLRLERIRASFQKSLQKEACSKGNEVKGKVNSYGSKSQHSDPIPSLSPESQVGGEQKSQLLLPKPLNHIPLGKTNDQDFDAAEMVEIDPDDSLRTLQRLVGMEDARVTKHNRIQDMRERASQTQGDNDVARQGQGESVDQWKIKGDIFSSERAHDKGNTVTEVGKLSSECYPQGAKALFNDDTLEGLQDQSQKGPTPKVDYSGTISAMEPREVPRTFPGFGFTDFTQANRCTPKTMLIHDGLWKKLSRKTLVNIQSTMNINRTTMLIWVCNCLSLAFEGWDETVVSMTPISKEWWKVIVKENWKSSIETARNRLNEIDKYYQTRSFLWAYNPSEKAQRSHLSYQGFIFLVTLVYIVVLLLVLACYSASKGRFLNMIWGDPKLGCYSISTFRLGGLGHLITDMGFSSPPIQPGKKRLMWTCRCGHRSYDDFLELRSGAVKRYEGQLRQHFNTLQGTNDSKPFNRLCRGLRLLGLSFGGEQNASRNGHQFSLPQFHTTVQPENGAVITTVPVADSLYLLLCIPHRKYATKLIQPELQHIRSDQAFFNLLRNNYRGLKGRVRSVLSLKTLRQIKFVQFEMYKSQLVDIRKQDDIPPEDRKDEYRYHPMPAEIVPPIGENLMMHLCSHPEDADDVDAFCLDRIPKKLKDRLLVCPTKGTGLGWGIHFIEGWHYSVIWMLAFVLLLLASLVFLVCWAVFEHDLQGASGVAAYMLAFVTLFIGSIQALFELN